MSDRAMPTGPDSGPSGASLRYLDSCDTDMGLLTLRRRREPLLDVDLYEVKLGDEYLMSSLFTAGETELARLALAGITATRPLDVLVGGLGLGYTAREALADPRVRSLHVVEALRPVIDWHERHLVPHADQLTGDARCRLVHGDFFALVAAGTPVGPQAPDRYDAVVVDIDHAPDHHLHPGHAAFYAPEGVDALVALLRPEGVFALWSDRPADPGYLATLEGAFEISRADLVEFSNPHTGGRSSSTVYVAAHPRAAATR